MSDKGFGGQLFDKVAKQAGISKSRIYKILTLQRLTDEVRKLGEEGKLREGVLLEIAKIDTPARQKLLADLAVEKAITVDQARQLSKLIRAAEKADPDTANEQWDAFFQLKEAIEAKGMTETLSFQLRQMSGGVKVAPEPPPETADPELLQSLGRPVRPECLAGRGLDVGTTNIVCAGRDPDGQTQHVLQRNAFLDIRNDAFTKKMLIKLGIDHVMHENRMYVIGDPAFELANIFEKETRRPMKDGLISSVEPESLQMIHLIIQQVLGPPAQSGEVVYFSVPAEPIDADRNVVYHRGALDAILRRQGYTPRAMIEGHAVVLSELAEEDYTGIGISCGGGMFNVSVSYKSVPALTFSTSRGGDWVDINVGKGLGIPASRATAIKEGGVDLANPRNREEEAICIYYRELIHYTLTTIKRQLETAREMPSFNRPVDLVCAGGTALIRGFILVFEEEYRKIDFPLEVAHIRLARDPLRTVAEGCLAAALEESEQRTTGKVEAPGAVETSDIEAAPVTLPDKLPERHPYGGDDRRQKDVESRVLPAMRKLPGRVEAPAAPAPEAKVVGGPREARARDASEAGPAETVLSPVRRLPPASGGSPVAPPEEHVASLPGLRRPAAGDAGPQETILPPPARLPGAAPSSTRKPSETVLPPVTRLPGAPRPPSAGTGETVLPPIRKLPGAQTPYGEGRGSFSPAKLPESAGSTPARTDSDHAVAPPAAESVQPPGARAPYEEEVQAPVRKLKLPKFVPPVPPPGPAAAPPASAAPAPEASEPGPAAAPDEPAPLDFGDLSLGPAEEQGSPLPPMEMEESAPDAPPPPAPPKKKPGDPGDNPPDISIPLIS